MFHKAVEEQKHSRSLSDDIKAVSISKYIDGRKLGNVLIGLLFIFLSMLFIISFSLHSIIPSQSQYKESWRETYTLHK